MQTATEDRVQKLAHERFNIGVDISAVASALGAAVFTVRDPSELVEALSAAHASVQSGRTALVEVFTSRVKARLSHLWEKS